MPKPTASQHHHTPGPWWASGLEVGTVPDMRVKVGRISGATYKEAEANARLIAAAPELLEALKRIVSSAPLTGLPRALELDISSACAAIAKAEGRT